MKLIDIDESTPHQNSYHTMQSDTNFVAPRTLSMLDGAMNDILNCSEIPDNEKWILYNQTLQKFLSYMKNKRTQDAIQKSHFLPNQHTPIQSKQQNQTPATFDQRMLNHSLNDIFPLRDSRDSIDLISQPIVREFFENARASAAENEMDNVANISGVVPLSPVLPIPDTSPNQSTTPPSYMDFDSQTTPSPQRRGAKRNASQNISNLTGGPPRKATAAQRNRGQPTSLFRQRNPPQSNNDFYWQPTSAK